MLRELIEEIYNICMEDLDANYRATDHIDYIMYRLNGGTETEAADKSDKEGAA